jgi:hypothetical protein
MRDLPCALVPLLEPREVAAGEVLRHRHSLHMRRVDAGAIAAEVIDLETVGDRSNAELVSDSVGVKR